MFPHHLVSLFCLTQFIMIVPSMSMKDTTDDLVEFCLVHFTVILVMYWFHSCYGLVDCRTRIFKFKFPRSML